MVRWDWGLIHDGVRGGSNGEMYMRWQQGAVHYFYIDECTSNCRWLHIKMCIKLNNNEANTKRGKDRYNPAHKFDFIWRTLVHNVNALTKESCIDINGDE